MELRKEIKKLSLKFFVSCFIIVEHKKLNYTEKGFEVELMLRNRMDYSLKLDVMRIY